MTVYVDNARLPYRRMLMCHMLADTLEELHTMADRIGVHRRHFQGKEKASCPHYDICLSKRDLALRHGAVEVSKRELVRIIQQVRDAYRAGAP